MASTGSAFGHGFLLGRVQGHREIFLRGWGLRFGTIEGTIGARRGFLQE